MLHTEYQIRKAKRHKNVNEFMTESSKTSRSSKKVRVQEKPLRFNNRSSGTESDADPQK